MTCRSIKVNGEVEDMTATYRIGPPVTDSPRAVFCRGTMCYEVGNGCLAKFSRQSDRYTSENDHLAHASSRGVVGVVKLLAGSTLCSTLALQGKSFVSKVGTRESDNRIFRCHVMKPAGRSLWDHDSVQDLLLAACDGLRGHWSLLVKADILHCDISPSNIIITDPIEASGWRGMLIDLDAAVRLDHTPLPTKISGTLLYMAVGVLRAEAHTFRHDLESFLYTIITLCIEAGHDSKKELPPTSVLGRWRSGGALEISTNREGSMTNKFMFKEVMSQLPNTPEMDIVRRFCASFRETLFGQWGQVYLGTPSEPEERDKMYRKVIKAFSKATDAIRKLDQT